MGLDIRWPIGIMFSFIGALLVIFGAASNKVIFETHSLGINIDLIWGIVLFAFGVFMLIMAWRGGKDSSH
jgi:hypothetical protein